MIYSLEAAKYVKIHGLTAGLEVARVELRHDIMIRFSSVRKAAD